MNKALELLRSYWFVVLIVGFIAWSVIDSAATQLPPPAPTPSVQETTALPVPAVNAVSLPNGTVIKERSAYMQGDGELKIENGTDYDALVKLINAKAAFSIYTVYVKAHHDYSIEGIEDGNYRVAFSSGSDWNSDTDNFNQITDTEYYEDTFDYETTDTQYTTWDLSLNPVEGGTAQTDTLGADQFNAY